MRTWMSTLLWLPFLIGLITPTWGSTGKNDELLAPEVGHKKSDTNPIIGRKIALVIGNSDYVNIPKLKNPGNDADDIGAALVNLGFDTIVAKDTTLVQFEMDLARFRYKAQDAEIAIFFYAGSAIQHDGRNFIIPVDALIKGPELLSKYTITFDEVQDAMKGVRGAEIMIFDACRDDPFKELLKAGRTDMLPSRGLAYVPIKGEDKAILFSTQADNVAFDGDGRNSPFSEALIEQLKQPSQQDISSMLAQVAAKVKESTGGKQSPELRTSISGIYNLTNISDQFEWNSIRDTHDPKVLRSFVSHFPNSPIRGQAEKLAEQFERTEAQHQKVLSVCDLSRRLLVISTTMHDRAGLERLAAEDVCPSLKPEINAALQSITALAQESERQKACADDAAHLDALRIAPSPNHIDEIQRLAGSPATCDRVRDAANRFTATLRDEEAKAEHDAEQAKICSAEAKTLNSLVTQGTRGAIEALGQARHCETLDVSGALASLDDLVRHREQQVPLAADQESSSSTDSYGFEHIIKENRVALVIGNSQYDEAGVLSNPQRDAVLMADTLKSEGFEVKIALNATRSMIINFLNDFADQASKADWALIYFAGHGIEIGGTDYLLPIDAKLKVDRDAQDEAISLNRILDTVENARKMRLVILDACRNNPFAKTMRRSVALRAVTRGLAPVEPQAGIMVVYAAAAGEVAEDGTGDHSPFTTALVNRMKEPGLEVNRLFSVVTADVLDATGHHQRPFEYGSNPSREEFFFKPPLPIKNFQLGFNSDNKIWSYLKDSNDAKMLARFYEALPLDSPIRKPVEDRLKEIEGKNR